MKNITRTCVIAIIFAFLLLVTLALASIQSKKPVLRLPDNTASMSVMSGQELDRLIVASPGSIHKIICYKGLRTIVADVEPLGSAVVDYGNTTDLATKARKAHVRFEVAEPVVAREKWSLDSLDWSFWVLLGLCGLAAGAALWRTGVFSRIPGLEMFSPIDAGTLDHPEERRTFDDVAGCEESIAKLRRVARWLAAPEWYEQFGAKLPRGILAVGPPGTGKTLLARALAGESDANFFAVHGSSFVEMFVGVGARRVRRLFASAVAARRRTGKPSIIFIDEIDAIGKKRSQGGSSADGERDQTLNQLLVCLQGFETTKGIVVMAATNMPHALDEALTRPGRFDYHVRVDLPDTLGREKIFGIHTKNMTVAPDVNLRDLAIRTPQFSGADIEQACNEAAIAAAERIEITMDGRAAGAIAAADKVVTLQDFDKGIDYVQFGDPMLSRARTMSQDDKRNTAFHEAGHCAVQQALRQRGADPITKVTIEPRTKSLGSMQSHPDGDRYIYTEEQLLARIMTAMGGRAAQEHFLGRRDTGASNDFEQAASLARMMVTEFGLSRLGPILIRTAESGRNPAKPGDQLANDIDNEWRRILDDCYKKALKIVADNERRVERIADALLSEQTIFGERFLELWGEGEMPMTRTESCVSVLRS